MTSSQILPPTVRKGLKKPLSPRATPRVVCPAKRPRSAALARRATGWLLGAAALVCWPSPMMVAGKASRHSHTHAQHPADGFRSHFDPPPRNH